MEGSFIERRILTGLIISNEYAQRIRKIWDGKLLNSKFAKRIAMWCIEYYDEYQEAPGQEIESIFEKQTKSVDKEEREYMEGLLESISDEYERANKFNVNYLLDQTVEYFDERNLEEFIEDIHDKLDRGQIVEAKTLAREFTSVVVGTSKDLDMSSERALDVIESAFTYALEPVVHYARQLGQFLNPNLIRGGFVAFMAPEKRGKTFLLLDIAMRAVRQGANVAFFQAGDMTEEQQVRRSSIYLTKKSDQERYSGEMYEPVRDCMLNQLDKCDLKQRECDYGPFEGESEKFIRKGITKKKLIKAYEDNKTYKPCHNCSKYWKDRIGATWLKKVDTGSAMTYQEAQKAHEAFFMKNNRKFKLSTHPTKTLTVTEMDNILDLWEREDGFVPDLVIGDYIDIYAPEIQGDFRHQENDKWMKFRGLTQKRHVLGITVTQTDADSYDRDTLSMKNYTEDKRKFGHVTAMYGINQDRNDREKDIGIMRLNEIVIREGEASKSNQVHVLQNLKRGQPALASYW